MSRLPALVSLALFGAVFSLGSAPGSALARQHADYGYSVARVWMTAVRLMRVDYASPITEKDRDDGYFLFEYPYQGKAYPGSVEVVPLSSEGGDSVRVAIQLAGMPSYVERMMLDKLRRKLESDFGPPGIGSRRGKDGESGDDAKRRKKRRDAEDAPAEDNADGEDSDVK